MKKGRYTPENEPALEYFLKSFGANQRAPIHSLTLPSAEGVSMPNGTTPSTGSRFGASLMSLRCTGVAQNGQRVAVNVPMKPMCPLQFGQTSSLVGAAFTVCASAGLRRSSSVTSRSRSAGWSAAASIGCSLPQLGHFIPAVGGLKTS